MSKDLKDFLSNLVESLLGKLRDPWNKYYWNFAMPAVFYLKNTSGKIVFKIMENIGISKDKLATTHTRHLQQLAIEISRVKMGMSPILKNGRTTTTITI